MPQAYLDHGAAQRERAQLRGCCMQRGSNEKIHSRQHLSMHRGWDTSLEVAHMAAHAPAHARQVGMHAHVLV